MLVHYQTLTSGAGAGPGTQAPRGCPPSCRLQHPAARQVVRLRHAHFRDSRQLRRLLRTVPGCLLPFCIFPARDHAVGACLLAHCAAGGLSMHSAIPLGQEALAVPALPCAPGTATPQALLPLHQCCGAPDSNQFLHCRHRRVSAAAAFAGRTTCPAPLALLTWACAVPCELPQLTPCVAAAWSP